MHDEDFILGVPHTDDGIPHPAAIPATLIADRRYRWVVGAGCYDLGNYWGMFVCASRFRWVANAEAKFVFGLIGLNPTHVPVVWALIDLEKVRAIRRLTGQALPMATTPATGRRVEIGPPARRRTP